MREEKDIMRRLKNQRILKTWVDEVLLLHLPTDFMKDSQWGDILSKNVVIGLNHAMHPV